MWENIKTVHAQLAKTAYRGHFSEQVEKSLVQQFTTSRRLNEL